MEPATPSEQLRRVAADHPLRLLLLLYGSRARGDGHPASDWDLGYLADDGLDVLALLADVTATLGTDDVDLVDLARASGLLRFRAASEGLVLHEAAPGIHHDFAVAAALHWYDVEPIVRRVHKDLLAGLPEAPSGT